ncbi:MAG: UDPGP type 1 family protein [Candidatus Pacebacteria bacterium]|nr:UDPGP type 1 family protein [Candidatus Paceibacterota bacterium]
MATMHSIDDLRALLRTHGQDHLLQFWESLDAEGRARLVSQLSGVDWESMSRWIDDYVLSTPDGDVPAELEPAPYVPLIPETVDQRKHYERVRELGVAALRRGEIGGFTVAGGQGTRLGYEGPKGTFPISAVKGKSLFQLFAETILRAQEKYETTIPWYIMTSPVNDADTRAFFTDNDFFGVDPDNIMFMVQGTMPAIGLDGKLLLGARDSLALSPNGHGGSLLALRKSGALDDMRDRGVKHISYWQVDNPLVHCLDPLFIGMHCERTSDMSCRSLTKSHPDEKLGNFCRSGNTFIIIEYSDMPDELSRARDEDGRLRFRAGSPAIHVLRRDFIIELTKHGTLDLPFHRAVKKVPYVNEKGDCVEPRKPNAVKLEMFIFDALPKADSVLILEADRHEQFSPVKNASGEDSPETCRRDMTERAARWLDAAGVDVPRTHDGAPDCVIELSPRHYLDAEDVALKAANIRAPRRGKMEYYD